MLDFLHLPEGRNCDVQVFSANASTGLSLEWQTWNKPRGVSMIHILCIGAGANGGNGAVGAVSAAAGGGGGGSGGITSVCVPASRLPDTLFCSAGSSTASWTVVSISPVGQITNHYVAYANRATAAGGGNASGGTAGAAGLAAAAGGTSLGGMGVYTILAGQAGIIGGAAVAGGNLTLPTTGLTVTGGTGGGGLPASSNGTPGGSFTVAGAFPPHSGGVGTNNSLIPGTPGTNGFDNVIPGLRYSYGGTGGGSSYASAGGPGLFGGNGGNGGIGCGGGGGGGCLTGGVAGIGGPGGPGQIIIIAW